MRMHQSERIEPAEQKRYWPHTLQSTDLSKWGSECYGVDRRCRVAEVKGVAELLGSTELSGDLELG